MIPYGSEVGFPFYHSIFNLSRLSGIVFNALKAAKSSGFRSKMSGVRPDHMPLFYWVVALGKLFTNIVPPPVFSAPRNWGTRGSIRTGPI